MLGIEYIIMLLNVVKACPHTQSTSDQIVTYDVMKFCRHVVL